MVLHTNTKCKVDGLGQSGAQGLKDCALDTAGSAGCDVTDSRANSFGSLSKGGHYVMEWDNDAIKVWFFPRGTAPRSLTSATPDTTDFGTPSAYFKGDCDIEERFKDQRFIFTNNFCGDWAGATFGGPGCPLQKDAQGKQLSPMDSCKKYVANNPKAFKDQFWKIGSFKTFTKKSVSSSSSSASMSKTSSKVSSSTKVSSSSAKASSTKISSSATSTKVSSSHVVSSSAHATSSAHVTSSASHAVSSSASSSAVLSSSVHDSVSSHASSDVHSASSVAHISSSTDAHVSATTSAASASSSVAHVSSASDIHASASASSDVQVPSPIAHANSSSVYYPTGHTSSVAYPTASGAGYPAGSSPSASVHYYGNFSAPVSYSVPAYNGHASVPVYGADAKSTPCTTSSAKGASYTPGYPVKNDYPYLPSFTPLSPVYPPTTSKATYDDYYQPPGSKTTVTTTYTTTYVDVCETGYTTKTTTFAVTYCPTSTPTVPTPGKPNNPPTYGWDVTTKVCNNGCGEGPKTVTVTVPCTQCNYAQTTPPPAVPNKPSCNGADCKGDTTITTKVYQTKIITLTKVPVPESQYYAKSSAPVYNDKPASKSVDAPKDTPVVSKPVVPASSMPLATPTPGKPVYGNGNSNGTISVGTGIKTNPSKTGYTPAAFTGAASGLEAGGFVAIVGVVAAFFL